VSVADGRASARARGPGVGLGEHGASNENFFALRRDVGNEGELVAVELQNVAQLLLLVELTVEALADVVRVHVEHRDVGLVVQGASLVLDQALAVFVDVAVVLVVGVHHGGDPAVQADQLQSQGLDRDDLVRVDVNLLLVALLVSEGHRQVEVLPGVGVVLGHKGVLGSTATAAAATTAGQKWGDVCGLGELEGGGSDGQSGKGCKGLHDLMRLLLLIRAEICADVFPQIKF
jgi:hypothetical protein